LNSEMQAGPAAEMKIISKWAWGLAAIAFVGSQVAFHAVLAGRSNAPPPWARPGLGLVLGLLMGCFALCIGYINRDAKRRGMSPWLWTMVALLIPNALGILLYFVLRQPRQNACAECGTLVQATFSFCPQCRHKLSTSCPRCERAVRINDMYCPYCGDALTEASSAGSER
jgi:RNA polymerase subunit RPABC4/transcription elongation factor Spt4